MLHSDFSRVSWRPIPGTSQELALDAPVNSLLLTGGRGWGKTETQLMRFRRLVGMGYGSHWRGVIFDREYKNLDDLVVKSKRLFKDLDGDDAQWLSSNSDFKWKWKTGEELLFRTAKVDDDYWSYHGHEYPFIGWNELTKYPTGKLYYKMLSVNRSGFEPTEHTPRIIGDNYAAEMTRIYGEPLGRPFQVGDFETPDGLPLPAIPLEVVSTTNPYGAGHNWVKSDFIDVAQYGQIFRKTVTIFDPKTRQDIEVTRTQTTLFGTFRENPYLSPLYIAGLYEETDENVLKAWLHGDWDIVAGGAFDDKWRKAIHVIPRFKVPKNWYVDRAMDWGSTHPFAVEWFATANGEEVTLENGQTFCPQPGSLIMIADLYGSTKIGTNTGTKMGAKAIAREVKRIEAELRQQGYVVGTIYPGPADNQIASVNEITTDTIEKMMADEGVTWEKSDKGKDSRVIGLELARGRLENAVKREGPALYFTVNCRASIATIPVLPRDEKKPDDIDTTAEDHTWDALRYRVLKGNNRSATVIKINFPR